MTKKMKIYLDNCCYNRMFDDQSDMTIKIETEIISFILFNVMKNEIKLTWSYILDYENACNPYIANRLKIESYKKISDECIFENDNVLNIANKLIMFGFKTKDALHIACAIYSNCDYFITTDKGIIKKRNLVNNIGIINPTEFIVLKGEII